MSAMIFVSHGLKNVGVIQGRRCCRLLFEAPHALRIKGNECGQHFDGDIAPQAQVARPVDFAHAASPEQRLNFVVPEPRTFFEPDGQRWGLTVTPEWRSVSTRAHLMGSSTFRSTLLD